jgi:hypothetical protein
VRTIVQLLLILSTAASLAATLGAADPSARIAFLDRGEIWDLGSSGRAQQKTNTGGKVQDFRYSPDGEYLAYSKRLKPGDGRPICSIVIVDVVSGRLITEIPPREGWIDIDKWLGSTLLYHSSEAMEVSGVFSFDASRQTGRELDLNVGSIALDSDATPDGAWLVYVDDDGVGPTYQQRLHLVDVPANSDSVQVSKRSIMAPALAPSLDAIAFVEVAGDGAAARDHVWVYRTSDRRVTMLDDEAVQPKSAGTGLAWSPDGRYVLTNFDTGVTVLDATGGTAPRRFRGTDACWLDSGTVVVGQGGGITAVDIESGATRSIVRRGGSPQCLRLTP